MKKLLTLLLLAITFQVVAQTYPVTGINISLPASPDANTANWGSGTSMFTITATTKAENGRVTPHVVESKLLVTIKKGGAKICGIYTGNSAPASGFNTLTKVWSGTNAVALLGQDCVLTPGDYEICVQFFDYGPAGVVPLSEEKTKAFSIRATEQQTNPISPISISLPASPDANTANWGSGTSILTITATTKAENGKVAPRVMESKLLVTIKKNGAKICGTYTATSAPESNFNTLIKVWSGSNAVSFLGQDCVLPPGDYEICVQFFGNGHVGMAPLSEEKCKPFSIREKEQQIFQSPQIIAPVEGTILSEADVKKPITFRWIPVIPRPQDPVTYRLTIWELEHGQSGTQAMISNQPLFTKDVVNLTQTFVNNLTFVPCLPPYSCDYIWNVQALNREGKPIGENNGTSKPSVFNIANNEQIKNSDGKVDIVDQKGTGTIILDLPLEPEDTTLFTIDLISPIGLQEKEITNPVFQWKLREPTDGSIGFSYSLQVYELKEGAVLKNEPFYEARNINSTTHKSTKEFNKKNVYEWKILVKNREGKIIGTSPTHLFKMIIVTVPWWSICFMPTGMADVNICVGMACTLPVPYAFVGGNCNPAQMKYRIDNSGVWNLLNSSQTTIPCPTSPTLSVGQHTITFRLNCSCGTQKFCTYYVNVFNNLTATIDQAEICNGQGAQLSIPNLPAGYTVNWKWRDGCGPTGTGPWIGLGLGLGNPKNTNAISPLCPAPCFPGQTFVTRHFLAEIVGTPTWPGGCFTANTSIKVWCPTLAGTITGANNYCLTPPATQNVTLIYSGGTYNSIQWTGPNGNLGNLPNQQVTIGPNAGSYSFSATIKNGTCSSITSYVTLIVENPLTAQVTGNKTEVCPNEDANLYLSPQPSGTIIQWQYQINCTGTVWTATTVTGTAQNTNSIGNMGPYPFPGPPTTSLCWRAIVSSPTGLCAPITSNTYQINIIQAPCTPIISTNGTLPKCPGNVVTLTASTACGTGPFTWKWYLNGLLVGTGPSFAATLPGNYTVEVFNKNQCESRISAPFKVTDCVTLVTITGPCSTNGSTTIALTANANSQPNPPPQPSPPCGGPYTYLWNTGATTQSITVTPTVTTIYTVTVTSGNGAAADCHTNATFTVKVCL